MSAPPIRAIFFDAGNTLIRMDPVAIAGALAEQGVRASVEDVQRAEWRARVRLETAAARLLPRLLGELPIGDCLL